MATLKKKTALDRFPPRDERGANVTAIGHLQLITEGLKQAVDNDWISNEEARAEIRVMLPVTADKDRRAGRADALRKKADEIEANDEGDFDD